MPSGSEVFADTAEKGGVGTGNGTGCREAKNLDVRRRSRDREEDDKQRQGWATGGRARQGSVSVSVSASVLTGPPNESAPYEGSIEATSGGCWSRFQLTKEGSCARHPPDPSCCCVALYAFYSRSPLAPTIRPVICLPAAGALVSLIARHQSSPVSRICAKCLVPPKKRAPPAAVCTKNGEAFKRRPLAPGPWDHTNPLSSISWPSARPVLDRNSEMHS